MPINVKFADFNSVTTHLRFMMNRYSPKRAISLLVFLFTVTLANPAHAFEGDAANGKKLFKQNCAACHKLDKDLVGPALSGVTERRSEEWLLAWIRNNAELRASGDADANAIFEKWNGSVMTAFPTLSDQDIFDILQYTVEGDAPVVAETPVGGMVEEAKKPDYTNYILGILAVLFLLLAIILIKMKNTLHVIQGEKPETVDSEVGGLWKSLRANTFLMTIGTLAIVIVVVYSLYWSLMGIGVEQGYEPQQPIAYSHKVHAGDNKIDCNYCHSSARHSKHSGIPSANVCMNCHKAIDGSEIKNEKGELKYGGDRSPEIAKIYAAIGWDPDKFDYKENHTPEPIRWKRIHNLPDLAYFNHAQHVNAGKLECQTCHGPIEEMEEVYQYAELTMGWCINCHRETEVKTGNGYYEGYAEQIKEHYHTEKVTVDKIGGMECGKCHY